MRANKTLNREKIMSLVAAISPMARDYVDDVFSDTVVLYAQTGEGNEGVFLKAASEDLCVYYASFSDDASSELLEKIDMELERPYLAVGELCFNVYGQNRRIIELVQKKGFVLDMEGYILQCDELTTGAIDLGGLTVDGFNAHMIDVFVELFESAYMRLNLENGWDTKSYSRDAESFCRRLIELHEQQLVQSFWDQGALLGCYIIEGNYIKDIVIHPDFQNRGYGSLILRHCLRFMREEKCVFDIYLRVTKSNEGARRLYERNGFRVISHFAEHTYKGQTGGAGMGANLKIS